jgi:cell division protein ZapA
MAQVVVQVNDRPYTMQCADGEEGHLRELAHVLDLEGLRELRTRAVNHGRSVEDQVAERLSEAAKRLEMLARGMEELV